MSLFKGPGPLPKLIRVNNGKGVNFVNFGGKGAWSFLALPTCHSRPLEQ